MPVSGRAASRPRAFAGRGCVRRAPAFRVRAAEGNSAQEPDLTPEQKAKLEEAMSNPEVQQQMAQMQQAMQNPQVQQQMNEMTQAMANPELQERLKGLQDDPEFEQMFKDIQSGGMGALMKYWNDPDTLRKLGERLDGVDLSASANAAAAAAPPADEINDLFDACRLGDLEAVEDFIAVGKDVNMQDAEGRSPLHYAAAHDHAHITRELIKSSANLEVVDSKNNTPLHYAAGYGRVDIVDILLDAGANTTSKNETGKTPIEIAQLNPNNPVVLDAELLEKLQAGATA